MLNADWFRHLHPDVVVREEIVERMWTELPGPESEAMLHLAQIMRCSDQRPAAPLCVEVARAFNADPHVVSAGFGYEPRRVLTPLGRDAWELCRQLAAKCSDRDDPQVT